MVVLDFLYSCPDDYFFLKDEYTNYCLFSDCSSASLTSLITTFFPFLGLLSSLISAIQSLSPLTFLTYIKLSVRLGKRSDSSSLLSSSTVRLLFWNIFFKGENTSWCFYLDLILCSLWISFWTKETFLMSEVVDCSLFILWNELS